MKKKGNSSNLKLKICFFIKMFKVTETINKSAERVRIDQISYIFKMQEKGNITLKSLFKYQDVNNIRAKISHKR